MPPDPGSERADVATLRDLGRKLDDEVAAEVLDAVRPTTRLRLLGEGPDKIRQGLVALEPRARRSVWNLQPVFSFDPADPGLALNDRSRARGVDLALITTPATVRWNPMISSIYPSARVGPVFTQAILVDESLAVVGGPRSAAGQATAWTSTDSSVVTRVREIWDLTLALSAPLVPDGDPPLSRRQVEVACRLAHGETDEVVARRLEVSPRTIEREVRAVLDFLGARSRTEAVLLMHGGGTGARDFSHAKHRDDADAGEGGP